MSDLVPVLHGQPAEYLMSSLKAYAAGKRQSGIMQPLAADLQDQDMRSLADYYAQLVPPKIQPKTAAAVLLQAGRRLVVEGAPESGVPPCVTCHTSENTTYPRLAGQHAAYMAGQLRLRKTGQVVATDNAVIMASIAQKLSEEQIEAACAYLASLPSGPLETSLPSQRNGG
jgi:cytochrome c553